MNTTYYIRHTTCYYDYDHDLNLYIVDTAVDACHVHVDVGGHCVIALIVASIAVDAMQVAVQ